MKFGAIWRLCWVVFLIAQMRNGLKDKNRVANEYACYLKIYELVTTWSRVGHSMFCFIAYIYYMDRYKPFLTYLASDILKMYDEEWPTDEEYKMGNKDYDRMAGIVKTKLTNILKDVPWEEKKLFGGLTVSPSTIERIVNHTWEISYTKDGRIQHESEKILHKLSLLFKARNWYDYVAKKQSEIDNNDDTVSQIISTVRKYSYARLMNLEQIHVRKPILMKAFDEDNFEEVLPSIDESYLYLAKESEAVRVHRSEQLYAPDGFNVKFNDIGIFVKPTPDLLTTKSALIRSNESYVLSIANEKDRWFNLEYMNFLDCWKGRWLIRERFLPARYFSIVLSSSRYRNLFSAGLDTQSFDESN